MKEYMEQQAFGGRPLTQEEYGAALRIERKRSRWFWCMMLATVLILSAAVIALAYAGGERALNRACLKGMGIDPQFGEANYNAYCMVAYHNYLHGTDIDYFSAEERREISPELEARMRRAYMMDYLYRTQAERDDFVPEMTREQFDVRIQDMARSVRAGLADQYRRGTWVCVALSAGATLFAAVMIVFPGGGRRLDARKISCRRGVMYVPLGRLPIVPVFMIILEDAEEEPEISLSRRGSWWNTLPQEGWLLMRCDSVPVLLVMAEGKIRHYPLALMTGGENAAKA